MLSGLLQKQSPVRGRYVARRSGSAGRRREKKQDGARLRRAMAGYGEHRAWGGAMTVAGEPASFPVNQARQTALGSAPFAFTFAFSRNL